MSMAIVNSYVTNYQRVDAQNIQGFPQWQSYLEKPPFVSICSDQTKPAWTYLQIQHVVRVRFPKETPP